MRVREAENDGVRANEVSAVHRERRRRERSFLVEIFGRVVRFADPRSKKVLHVAEIAQALHQVFFVLGAARALGRAFEVLEPGGLLVCLFGTDFAAE